MYSFTVKFSGVNKPAIDTLYLKHFICYNHKAISKFSLQSKYLVIWPRWQRCDKISNWPLDTNWIWQIPGSSTVGTQNISNTMIMES